MLNQNLRISELQNDLDEYLDIIDLIQNDILGEQSRLLIEDKKRLGLIHHALNIQKYKQPQFRQHLLEYAPEELLQKFLKNIGLNDDGLTSENRLEIIKKASEKAWGNNLETKMFIETFEYPDGLIPKQIENIDDEQIIKNPLKPINPLWEYQSKIFYKAVEETEISSNRFIITMPTGAGKTKTAMAIVTQFLNTGFMNKELRQVLWIANNEELCEQAIESFIEVWPHYGKNAIKLYRFWGKSTSSKFEKNSIIISTYGKLKNISNKNLIEPDLIICDEAHNVIAKTYHETIKNISKYESRIIGLTATPVRVSSIETDELKDFFNDHEPLSIDIENEDNAIEYLQKRKFLSRFNSHTIPSNVKFRVSKELLKLIEKDRDLPKDFLKKIADSQDRNLVIARLLYKLGKEGIKVLYFSPSIEQSKLMCASMISFGFNAAHVDGKTPTDYRKEIIQKFKAGEIKILCNFGIFTTGFDDPKIEAVVIGRPTTSIVLHTQMIGRGMRGEKMGGSKTFELYRINDDLPGIVLADNFFKEIWENGD